MVSLPSHPTNQKYSNLSKNERTITAIDLTMKTFFEFPGEIRAMIYGYAFIQDDPIVISVTNGSAIPDSVNASAQFRREASHFFLGENLFVFDVTDKSESAMRASCETSLAAQVADRWLSAVAPENLAKIRHLRFRFVYTHYRKYTRYRGTTHGSKELLRVRALILRRAQAQRWCTFPTDGELRSDAHQSHTIGIDTHLLKGAPGYRLDFFDNEAFEAPDVFPSACEYYVILRERAQSMMQSSSQEVYAGSPREQQDTERAYVMALRHDSMANIMEWILDDEVYNNTARHFSREMVLRLLHAFCAPRMKMHAHSHMKLQDAVIAAGSLLPITGHIWSGIGYSTPTPFSKRLSLVGAQSEELYLRYKKEVARTTPPCQCSWCRCSPCQSRVMRRF